MQFVRTHRRVVVVLVLVALVFVLFGFYFVTKRESVLEVSFINVGQGDAVFIQGPSGAQVLYDAGPSTGAVLRELSGVMPWYDRSIDVAIMSHPDLDHIGGFPELFKRYHVGLVLEPGVFSGNGAYEVSREAIATNRIAHELARKGQRLDLGDGAYLYILYPVSDMTGRDTNEASIVALLVYGDTRVLLSGDLPEREESEVVALYGDGLHADVLKAGHHGSRTSNSALWLSAIQPKTVVISRGLDNSYGHPHKEVVERLREFQIPYVDTARDGTVRFRSDGKVILRI